MCYVNGVRLSLADFIEYKRQQKELRHLQQAVLMQPARTGFDYSKWPVIKPSADGKDWEPVAMEWGFIPSWPSIRNRADVEKFRKGYTDASGKFHIPYTTLNAVGEELLYKDMYRESALTRRCLVLSSGFYEHRHVIEMGKKGQPLKTPGKYPYHIHLKYKKNFLIAGIYNTWTDSDTGEVVDTFAIDTTKANSLMRQIHNSKNRMPVILPEHLADEWTEPGLTEKRIHELATYQYPASAMKAHPISKEFLKNEDPTEPFAYEILEELVFEDE
jgi:putative SOS response-associated peptidase YedK